MHIVSSSADPNRKHEKIKKFRPIPVISYQMLKSMIKWQSVNHGKYLLRSKILGPTAMAALPEEYITFPLNPFKLALPSWTVLPLLGPTPKSVTLKEVFTFPRGQAGSQRHHTLPAKTL